MKILGFYCRHDANIATYDTSSGKFTYFKHERDTGIKHCPVSRHGDDIEQNKVKFFEFLRKHCETFRPDVIVFCGGVISECRQKTLYTEFSNKQFFDQGICDNNCRVFCIDHHYAHVLSCWPVKRTKDVDVGVCLDGGGGNGLTGRIIATPESPEILYNESRGGVGLMLNRIGQELMNLNGVGLDMAGKVMGAQSYGHVSQEMIEMIDPEVLYTNIEMNWRLSSPNKLKFGDPVFNDWLATIHHLAEKYTIQTFADHCKREQTITYSGGIAQNTVFNDTLHSLYDNLHIIPHCYDGGLSLGCLELARILFDLPEFKTEGFPYWQNDVCDSRPSPKTIARVASALASGKIVGWFQGRGEIGPRALGNRSILMDPSIKDGKSIINEKVKHREYWRPYGPSVLEEEAHKWFMVDKPSPYMLRAVMTREDMSGKIPSVVHVDRTSRIQTVNRNQNEDYYDLIACFFKLTGIPMLLNTSLNSGGSPIFSTKAQCLDLLQNTSLDMMCFGDEIIHNNRKIYY